MIRNQTLVKNKVTAIIPCYNDGQFIMEAVESLVNQTLLPEKILIIDDGSNSETKKVLKAIDHPIVEVIYQKNKGVAIARNVGIEKAATEYILTLDADDYFEPTFAQKAWELLEDYPKKGAVVSFYKKLNGDKLSDHVIKPKGGHVENFLQQNNGPSCALFRKLCWSQANGYDSSFKKGYEDWDFWLSVLSNGWEMHVLDEPLFIYRQKLTSRDKQATEHDTELRLQLLNKHVTEYQKHSQNVLSEFIKAEGKLKKKIIKTEESYDFKIGKFILTPFRFVKALLK